MDTPENGCCRCGMPAFFFISRKRRKGEAPLPSNSTMIDNEWIRIPFCADCFYKERDKIG